MCEELKAFVLISNNSQRFGISYFSGDLLQMRTEIRKLQSCCCFCYKVYSIPVRKPKHATPSTELGQLETDTRRSTRIANVPLGFSTLWGFPLRLWVMTKEWALSELKLSTPLIRTLLWHPITHKKKGRRITPWWMYGCTNNGAPHVD
jgi:hypothetical protein